MRNIMKSHTRGPGIGRQGISAFTLVELLTVVVILGLLAMLLFPSLADVYGVARSAQCTSRLKEIGKAVKMLEAQEGTMDMQALFWQDLLSKYLGDSKAGMICPEYAHLAEMRGQDGGQEAPSPIPLRELAAFRIARGSTVWYEDMGEGPFVAKLSDVMWNKARADGWLVERGNNFPKSQYKDGSEERANPYWLCLEDHGNDWDQKDVMVQVTFTGAGYLLRCMSGSTGHQNSVVSKPDLTELQKVPSRTAFGSLEPLPIGTTGIIASYGMNMAVPTNLETPGSILVMDYHWLMASPGDNWSDYPNPENSSIPVFARHNGRVNVLFVDGSVRTMDPHDIDPNNVYIERTYWLP